MFKAFVIPAALLISAGAAEAAVVNVSGAVSPISLNQWSTGYNVGLSLSFADVLGPGDSLPGWTLEVKSVEPGAFFSTLWVNGSGDPAVCAWGSPLSMSGYGATTAAFVSSCEATEDKRFDFFLQVQNGTYNAGDLTFSLSSDALPEETVTAVPLPAAGGLLAGALAALVALRRRRPAA